MSDITKKTLSELIDQLITTNIKCFLAQDRVMQAETDAEVAEAAKLAQSTNARRSQLMRAIDQMVGETNLQSPKTYE